MTYEEASHARCHLMVTTTAIETSWCHSTYTYSTRRGYAAVIRGRNNRYKPWYMQTNLNSGDFAITWISVICCALGAEVDIKLYMSRVRRVLLAILPYIYFSLFMALVALCCRWWQCSGCYHSLCMAPAPWSHKDTCGATSVQETCPTLH